MLSLFDVSGSHSHVLLSKHKNDEWQDLGPWMKKLSMLTFGKIMPEVIHSPNVPLCLYDQIWTVTIDQIWTVTIDPQRQTNMTENTEMFMTWERNVYLVSDN